MGLGPRSQTAVADKRVGVQRVSQKIHVGIWYILKAQRGSHIPTLRPKYTPYSYMDPLGLCFGPWEWLRESQFGGHGSKQAAEGR